MSFKDFPVGIFYPDCIEQWFKKIKEKETKRWFTGNITFVEAIINNVSTAAENP